MPMPNADRAVVDIVKVRDYCLNSEHPRGRHKARVFAAALGFTAGHAAELCELLSAAARAQEAILGDADEYGQRYVMDFPVSGPVGQSVVRSTWTVRAGEDFPRLTSCYVL